MSISITRAKYEMKFQDEFDAVVINNDIDEALEEIKRLI